MNNSIRAQNQNLIKALKNFRFRDLGKYLKKNLKINKKPIEPILGNYLDETNRNSNNGIVIYGLDMRVNKFFKN